MKCQIFIAINKRTIPHALSQAIFKIKLKSSSNLIPSTHLEGKGDEGGPVSSKLKNIFLFIWLSLKNYRNKKLFVNTEVFAH